jgi:hypothetical protein
MDIVVNNPMSRVFVILVKRSYNKVTMGRSKEDMEREYQALGISIESGQSFPPRIHLIGHGLLPTQKLTDLFKLAEYLTKLADERSDFFDSEPETWWEKLSEQGKQNAKELFLMIWKGYNRSREAAFGPIISARCLEISPATLRGEWYTDGQAADVLWILSLVFAGLFDHKRLTASDIVERLFKSMQSLIDFGKQLQDQLEADVDSLQAFADFLAGRSATYTDALLTFYFTRKPIVIFDRAFTEVLNKSVRDILVSPSLYPPYPKSVLRLHTLGHQFANQGKVTEKVVDAQLIEFMKKALLEETESSPYYRELQPQIETVIAHNPRKALLVDLLLESRETGKPVTELAKKLPGEFEPLKLSKQVSRIRRELESAYEQEDPLLTFLRKIDYA